MKKLLLLSSIFIATSVMANPKDYKHPAHVSVAQALKSTDDSIVKLKGKILDQVDDEEFIFSDGDEKIKIAVDSHVWEGQNVTPNDIITIEGRMERRELDVHHLVK